MPNILDLASPDPIEAYYEGEDFAAGQVEHIHPVERMTGLDHLIYAFGIAAGITFWAIIWLIISTLFHLSPLASLIALAWPFSLVPLVLLTTEVIMPLGRLIKQKAARIEGYNND